MEELSGKRMRNYQRQLVERAVLIEGGLLGVALLWAFFRHIPLRMSLIPMFPYFWIGIGAGLVLLLVNYVLIEYGSQHLTFFQRIKVLMKHDVAPLFRTLHVGTAIIIAIVSGIAEEVFFRGVVQAEIGVLGASILFGLAHVWKKTAIPYGVYAAVMGVYLGGLSVVTQNLWVPILAHTINNFVAILYCKYIPDFSPDQELNSKQVEL